MALAPGPIIDPWWDVPERSKVRITAAEIGSVTGLVPEAFTFTFKNDYVQPFAQILASFNTGVVAAQELLAEGGKVDFTLVLQELKRLVWSGASNLSFSLPLFYLARRSAQLDVINPIKRLVTMSAPSTGVRKQIKFLGKAQSGTVALPPPIVQVEVGDVLRLKKAVIGDVTINLPTNVTNLNGQPNEALVTIGIQTHKMFLADDTEVEFMGGSIDRWVAAS